MPRSKFEVFFTRFAEDDLGEIIGFYIPKNSSFASRLVEVVESRITELASFPDRGRVVPELERRSIVDYREFIEGNYRIIYKVENLRVYILAIVDGRRNFEEVVLSKLMRIV
jgi:toxin ParE1/3/4